MCRSTWNCFVYFLWTCNIFCDSSLQCPARWTNIQAVVSPGPNPLPAEVRIKRSAAFGDNFYYVDQKQWEIKAFALKTYADPIQEIVWKMIGRCFIFSFALFEYQEDIDVKNFCQNCHCHMMHVFTSCWRLSKLSKEDALLK